MKRDSVFRTIIMIMIVLVFGISMAVHENPVFAATGSSSQANFKKPIGYSAEIEPYVSFLKTVLNNNPVDYVISLFDSYDIVVLCERDHRDITQYELIYKIVSDPRFIQKSGWVFTEIGSQTLNDRLNTILKADHLKETEVNQQLISIYRDLSWSGYWEKYNLFDYLMKVYSLNDSLPVDQKVSVNFTDIPIDWNGMTKEKYDQNILSVAYSRRDKVMADFIIDRFQAIKKSKSERTKILVIMNYRHAFKLIVGNTVEYLNKEFPGKVANIMINSLKPLPGSDDHNDVRGPIQNGKWDAAFRYLDNPNSGFDFKNTPFGKDHFDYFDFIPHEYTYQEIFHGFIFYYPLEKHFLVTGIPGFVDEKFLPILKERAEIIKNDYFQLYVPSTLKNAQKEYNTKKEQYYPDIKKYNKEIEPWLKYK